LEKYKRLKNKQLTGMLNRLPPGVSIIQETPFCMWIVSSAKPDASSAMLEAPFGMPDVPSQMPDAVIGMMDAAS